MSDREKRHLHLVTSDPSTRYMPGVYDSPGGRRQSSAEEMAWWIASQTQGKHNQIHPRVYLSLWIPYIYGVPEAQPDDEDYKWKPWVRACRHELGLLNPQACANTIRDWRWWMEPESKNKYPSFLPSLLWQSHAANGLQYFVIEPVLGRRVLPRRRVAEHAYFKASRKERSDDLA